ncbi:unnamed protein product [Lupinus luteus]|uniref:Uncharacterized protein n=1 Tax=Lupinus luteus TaxID=3873 RepID=A0AAV1WAB0_LUPLU
MAIEVAKPFHTIMTLLLLLFLFSLLLVSHFTFAVIEHNFSPLTSTKEGSSIISSSSKKKNNVIDASAREETTQNSDMALREGDKSFHSVHEQVQGSMRGYPRVSRSRLRWRNRIFNDSAHEVPSGPNPIANRVWDIISLFRNFKLPSISIVLSEKVYKDLASKVVGLKGQ